MSRLLAALVLVVLLPAPLPADERPPSRRAGDLRGRPVTQASPASIPPAANRGRIRLTRAQAPGDPARAGSDPISPAEQINRLQRTIEGEAQNLARLKAERDDPDGEYARARARFERADKALEAAKKALQGLPAGDVAGRKQAAARVVEQEKLRTLAKNRFDLAIETRRFVAEQVANLEQIIRRDRQALDRLQNVDQPQAAENEAPTPVGAGDTGAAAPSLIAPRSEAPAPGAVAAPTAAPGAVAAPTAAPAPGPAPAAKEDGKTDAPPAGAGTVAAPPAGSPQAANQELIAAEKEAQTRAAASKAADKAAHSATERLAALDREIALEKRLLAAEQKQRDNEAETRRDLSEVFRTRSLAGAPRSELDGLLDQVRRAEKRLQDATKDAQEHVARLEELHSERAALQAEQIAALHKAEEAKAQVKAAEDQIRSIENPLRPRNVLLWLVDHGPKILVVLLAMLVAHWFSKHFCERVIWLIAHKGARGTSAEREDRARTLVGVFYNAASVTIVLGGGLMVLQEAGIPIAPLVGGAAVFGLAVAFGAQNLIRDYFYGFVILLENQYKLNDVVKIGNLSGQVEQITLRMTVLRDLEGCVHFVPNGQVTAVTNMTHGWSRALFDIGVAYKEDVDRVIAVLATLARELQADPQFGPLILEEATMLGVDGLGDSAVVIKFFIKTRPLQQWTIRRELLRRIKNRFDELGIEIPFPHRTVYHRAEVASVGAESVVATPRIVYGTHQV